MINKKKNIGLPAFLVIVLTVVYCGSLVFTGNSYGANIPKGPFYILKVKKRFKNALFDLKQGIEDANFSILAVAPISTGIKGIGRKIPHLRVIDFCNLHDGYDLLKNNMNYSAFMPCRIAIYKDGKYTVMISYLPTYFSKFFKNTPEQKKTVIKVTRKIISIMNSVKTGF
ncbi:MAG: DUF302 domain-containing protein [Candidatus Acidulodesulfobacterium acidiphilum]|uniref:DUF302 domain-containing protein n=1 Tax=Candidatus Acidulodesulfobacterium acidiphilum TaxID=2597224 RepID=A0A520XF56_9DELT|nr:MAG: DUF302 domain-containing protein [Candidatus Acidulodesulfobacterium acidiphilum]